MANPKTDNLIDEAETMAFLESLGRGDKTQRELFEFFKEMESTDGEDYEDAEDKGNAAVLADPDDDSDNDEKRLRAALSIETEIANADQEETNTRGDHELAHGHMMRPERLIKRDLVRRHNVLLVRVGLNSESDDRYFWDCAEIVQAKADSCMVITNNVNKTKDFVRRMAEKTTYLCEWLPVTLGGFLRNQFYLVRSWFTGLSAYRKSLKFAPTLVFVDAHPIVIPLFKILYSCPVITFYFYDKMLDRTNFIYLPTKPRTAEQSVRNFFLSRSNELLVPSKATGYKFTEQFKNCSFTPIAFYPPCHGKGTIVPVMCCALFNFLIIGPWQNYANMEFALKACRRFYNTILGEELKPKFRFIFIGFMDVNDFFAKGYKSRMLQVIKDIERPFGDTITTITNPTHAELWDYYRTCMGVINVTTCDFAWPVLEAIYFGKMVICLSNRFTAEVVDHATNGFLQKKNVNEFADHMYYLCLYAADPLPEHNTPKLLKDYSHSGRKLIIEQLLLKYFPLTDKELTD